MVNTRADAKIRYKPFENNKIDEMIYCGRSAPGAKTLPSKYFTNPRLFEREIELFFGQGWVWVGRAETIANPGRYFLREVAGESVIVLREAPGSVHAFDRIVTRAHNRHSTPRARR